MFFLAQASIIAVTSVPRQTDSHQMNNPHANETPCWPLQHIAEEGGRVRQSWQSRSWRVECWGRSLREPNWWLTWELTLGSGRVLVHPCPWNVHSTHCSHGGSLFQGHSLERIACCWDHLHGIRDRTQFRPL